MWTVALLLATAAGLASTAPSANPIPVPWEPEDYRLPKAIEPTHYDISLKPHFQDRNFEFDGVARISIKVTTVTDKIVLHAGDMTILSVYVYVGSSMLEALSTGGRVMSESHQTLSQTMREPLAVGDYTLLITYVGHMRDDMYGFYRSYYYVNGIQRWLGTTQFQPTHARRAFPCWDEPAFKATFAISIVRNANMNSLSNMPLIRSEEQDGGLKVHDFFENTPKMSTYLIAFVVSDFTPIEASTDTNFKVWARTEAILQGKYSADISPDINQAMETFTGLTYQLPKMDKVAVPDFSAGAMENWGLVTYRERLILYEQGITDAANKQRIATVIAHEIGHMWFGNLVSPLWWEYLWLNEGFATYFEYFATSEVETTWRLDEQFVVRAHQSALLTDSVEASRPMTSAVTSPASIRNIFDTISYAKAGSVIRMMEHFLGTTNFRAGLTDYLNNHEYDAASPSNLFAALQAKADPSIDVAAIMNSWTTQMGYPVITVTRDTASGGVSLTQKRFLLRPVTEPVSADIKYHVPITFTRQSNADFENTKASHFLRIEDPSLSLPLSLGQDEWVLFNIQETGYYRVNYDERNWALLTAALRAQGQSSIPPVNRAQIVDDALNLARANELPYSVALDVTRFLEVEQDYVPWLAALNGLTFLDRRLQGRDGYSDFQEYLRTLLANAYHKLPAPTDHVPNLYQNLLTTWACNLGMAECVQDAKNKFSQYMSNPDNPTNWVLPDLKSIVYCVGVQEGGAAEWNFLWNRLQTTNYASEESLILAALGCTRDDALIRQYLQHSITPTSGIRRQDAASVFTAVYVTPQGVQSALNFLDSNFDDIQEFYGGMTAISTMLSGIAARLSTEEQAQELKGFVERNKDKLQNALTAAEAAIKSVEENVAWADTYGAEIQKWLTENIIPTTTEPTTEDPNTSDAATTEPSTDDPDTSEADTTEPSTDDPDTSEADTTEPSTDDPDTSEADTTEPSTDDPDTSEADTTEPSTDDPDTSEATTAETTTEGDGGSVSIHCTSALVVAVSLLTAFVR